MISAWTQSGSIMASYRDVTGSLSVRRIGDASYVGFVKSGTPLPGCRIVDRCPDHPGWDRVTWIDYDARKRDLENNQSLLFEADVSPVRRFMTDHLCKLEPPRRCFMDIETDSRGSITEAMAGLRRVLAIVVIGDDGRRFKECLQVDTDHDEGVLINRAHAFMQTYDQVPAWNGDRFDFVVMKERAKLLKLDYAWERRLLFVDQLAAYKRFNTASESGDEKTSMSLQSVSMALLGEGKNDFNARKTWEAWAAGGDERQRMLDYCEQDTELLLKIEKKTGFLDLFQTLCTLTTALPNSHGLKPTAQFDAMSLRKAHLAKTRLPSKIDRVGEKYEGAFVMKSAVRGIMRDVHVCDFASLYPSMMRTWNMGWETKGLAGCTSPGTGVKFANATESILAGVIRECMDLRTVHKKRKGAATPGTEEWKDADRKSTAYKVFVNSGYGVVGSPYSRFYNRELVESVTLNGQWLIKQTIAAAEERGYTAVYGDTDSVFVVGCTVEEFDAFVRWCNRDLYPRLLAECGCNPAQSCVKLSYEKCFDRLIVPLGKGGTPVGKRYAGSYKSYEGKPGLPICPPGTPYNDKLFSKPEIKGVEYKRADSIKYARRLQETCILKILAGEEDPDVLQEWVSSERTKFFNGAIDVADIATTKGISQPLKSYKVDAPHVRVARELEAAGEDVSEGTRISYIITDGSVSPAKVISTESFSGEFDRFEYWNAAIWPCLERVLAGAFPDRPWERWRAKRPKKAPPGQLAFGVT